MDSPEMVMIRSIKTCLDYRAFMLALEQSACAPFYEKVVNELREMGEVRPVMGSICQIHDSWGYLIIPPEGFPEIRINFYKKTPAADIEQVLASVMQIIMHARSPEESTIAN